MLAKIEAHNLRSSLSQESTVSPNEACGAAAELRQAARRRQALSTGDNTLVIVRMPAEFILASPTPAPFSELCTAATREGGKGVVQYLPLLL